MLEQEPSSTQTTSRRLRGRTALGEHVAERQDLARGMERPRLAPPASRSVQSDRSRIDELHRLRARLRRQDVAAAGDAAHPVVEAVRGIVRPDQEAGAQVERPAREDLLDNMLTDAFSGP